MLTTWRSVWISCAKNPCRPELSIRSSDHSGWNTIFLSFAIRRSWSFLIVFVHTIFWWQVYRLIIIMIEWRWGWTFELTFDQASIWGWGWWRWPLPVGNWMNCFLLLRYSWGYDWILSRRCGRMIGKGQSAEKSWIAKDWPRTKVGLEDVVDGEWQRSMDSSR